MRYLGKKSKLLAEIEASARAIGFTSGRVCDLFAGSGVVGRHFRGCGHEVWSTDLMACSYVQQKVLLESEEWPRFEELSRTLGTGATLPLDMATSRIDPASNLPGDPAPLLGVLQHLEDELEPREGVLTRQFSEAGPAGRMYFMSANAARLDAMLLALREWRAGGALDEAGFFLLLATIIDAADRVANISGTYGAFLKKWQTNARHAVELRVPRIPAGPRGRAHLGDALEWIAGVEADLLYIDPPYNDRQYSANYHVLDAIARLALAEDPAALEGSLYGKTGMLPWAERASPLCSERGSACRDAFARILRETTIPRVVISYNEEGIIDREEFRELLAEYAGVATAELGEHLRAIPYARFRSDADGRVATNGAKRSYRTVPGRERDVVHEWLLFATRRTACTSAAS